MLAKKDVADAIANLLWCRVLIEVAQVANVLALEENRWRWTWDRPVSLPLTEGQLSHVRMTCSTVSAFWAMGWTWVRKRNRGNSKNLPFWCGTCHTGEGVSLKLLGYG